MVRLMIFVTVFFLVSVTTHFFLYRFAVRVLAVTHPAGRALMLVAFAVLALSFMAAFFRSAGMKIRSR